MVVQRPVLSVVIPTFEREELLCRCLEDVLMQDHACFETIVVDQSRAHKPETDRFLKEIESRVRYVRLDRPSVTAASNHGARLATGVLLVFLDDDVRIPDRAFLRKHEACYEDPSVEVVAGRVRDPARKNGEPYNPLSRDQIWGWYYTAWDHDVRAEVVTAPGANMSCRRAVFWDVGGFDERFTRNAVRFENDFCLRVRKAGGRVVFEPSAWVVHQYNSLGGHSNRHLLGTSDASHAWYASYFRNMTYMTLKHMPWPTWPLVFWKLWREHVMNRPFLKMGVRFVARRHRVFLDGLHQGFTTWQMSR